MIRQMRHRRPLPPFYAMVEELQTLVPEQPITDNMNFLLRYALPALLTQSLKKE